MIQKLIALLQWFEASEKPKRWFDLLFSFTFTASSISLVYTILGETLFRSSYYYGYGSYSSGLASWATENTWIFCISIFLLLSILGTYIYGIYKKLTSREYSIIQIIINGVLPLTVGILLLSIRGELKWYVVLFGISYVLFPIIFFFRGFRGLQGGIIERGIKIYGQYIVSFLIGLAIFSFFYISGNLFESIFDIGYYGLFSRHFFQALPYLFFGGCIYGLSIWFILAYAWAEVGEVSGQAWKYIQRGGVILAFLFLFIWMSPNWKDLVIEDRISAAANILQGQGNTKKEYEAAESIWFLKWAFQEKYREHRLYGSEKILYEEIYDHSIESDMGEDIDTNAYRSWNSNATSLLAKGENAKVELNFAKHETEILPDIHAARTTVTYEFQNTDTSNQEVIFSVMLPNAASTMIDLRLGVNLEYSGVIAPRGAASHVYEDSLRRNTDPALLEQTGPLTYRLRAYPVPPKTDSVSQGRQRVQFTYVTPLEGDMLSLIPRTDIINLKLTKKSEIVTRVTVGDKSLSQDSKSGDDMTLLTDGKIEKVKSTLGNTYDSYCSLNTYPHIDVTTFKAPTKKLTKNIVFFDISRSVGEKSLVKKQYQSLIDTWKNTGVALDVFTYNTDVYPSGYSLADTDFWGTTDMSKVTDYIDKNNISDTNIVIVTDDNSYEKANSEIKSIDYKKLKSNRISLIQVGKEIRTLKTEITKALLATDGSMIIVDATVPLSDAVKNFFSEKKSNETCTSYSGSAISTLQALQGYEDGKKVFGKNYSYIGYVSRFGEPFRGGLNNPLIKDLMSGSTIDKTSPIYIDVIDFGKSKFYVYKDGVGRDFNDNNSYHNFLSSTKYLKGTTMLTINLPVSAAYFQISDGNGYASQETKLFDTEELKKLIPMTKSTGESVIMSEGEIQEEIGKTSHTINQAVSLIALQNDFQRNQLDQYSQNSDKYDTTYDNLSNAESNSWNRRSGGCGLFGCNKATSDSKSLSIGSQGSSGLLSNSFGGSSGRMTQYIVVIIGFPLIAWFVLRRKPKKVIVVPPAQVTTQDSPK